MAYAPATPYGGGNVMALREGLEKLKKAALLYLVSALLVGIGFMALITSGALFGAAGALSGAIGMFAAALVGAILGLAALFAFLIPAFSTLKDYDVSRFGTPAKLVKIGYGGGLALFFLAMLVLVAAIYAGSLGVIFAGLALFGLAGILLFIGMIGIIMGMFKLKEITGEGLFTAAGVLFIIGIFVNILTFIAWILVFVAAGKALNRIGAGGYAAPPAQPAAPGAPPPPPA